MMYLVYILHLTWILHLTFLQFYIVYDPFIRKETSNLTYGRFTILFYGV